MRKLLTLCFFVLLLISCKKETAPTTTKALAPFFWEASNVYFLLTDRFNNGDTSNDINYNRTKETGKLRNFMGGDIKGITQKIKDGYFTDLGINAIWFSPVVEQIHGSVDEGTGNTYGFHGYWTKDWTQLDPNFGTKAELSELVKTAHEKGIRILMDVVINHTGPVTEVDPAWEDNWVRTSPKCEYTNYENTTSCTLVENLPDILTHSDIPVELPQQLLQKWEADGSLEKEIVSLNSFFERTGYPKAPRYYIIKWLTDYVRTLGIDGFRVDTTKHVEETVWADLYKEASIAFNDWKASHPKEILDDNPFFMVGEVYNYSISSGRNYDFGDKKVDYFNHGFSSLINFGLKYDAQNDYEQVFTKYDSILNHELKGRSVLNYLTSHDDGGPFDKKREKTYEAATKLLLTPGASQVYYGDELARSLEIEGTEGDATLRSFMNWEDLENNSETQQLLAHYQKLGIFRKNHPAIGMGRHQMIPQIAYVFSRTLKTGSYSDTVLVALDTPVGIKEIFTGNTFTEGTQLKDIYSGHTAIVEDGKISIDTEFSILLLEEL
ncbi:alpha-amylase [Flavobacteriaceae bacterium R38]|nr:alpha-amylase [Flavobacteriaceae bacterium R38]